MTLPADGQLARIIDGRPSSGAFFLHGDVIRLRDDAARRLTDAALDPATRDFNLDRFRGDDLDPGALAAAIAMPPMMAESRVVLVSEAQRLTPTARNIVLEGVRNVPAGLLLVVTATIPSGSKAAFYRDLKSACTTLEWKSPRDSEIPGWLIERAREEHGFELEPRAAQAIAATAGSDLSILDAELVKLAAAAASGELTLERVRELVPELRRMDRWSWLDLVAERRYGPALAEIEGVLATDRGVGLLAGLVEQHVFIGLATEGGQDLVRRTLSETGRGYLGWKARIYGQQARKWDGGALEKALVRMRRADGQLKRGGGDLPVLQELLLGLRSDAAAA